MVKPKYLKLRGRQWWVRVKVPKALRLHYSSPHVEHSLKTEVQAEAEHRSRRIVFEIMEDFRRKQRELVRLPQRPDEADEHRRMLAEAELEQDPHAHAKAQYLADRKYEELLALDPARAKRFAEYTALGATRTLREAFEDWLPISDLSAGTQAKYRRAFDEFLGFLTTPDVVPNAITRDHARLYVIWLNTKATSAKHEPLDPATKKGRVLALASFWKYLAHADLIEQDSAGIWHGHTLTGAKEKARRKPKERDWTPDEMISLAKGPERGEGATYTKRTILELCALGFYTGARIEEICSRKVEDFEPIKGGYVMHIREAKTPAGVRDLPILHPIPVGVIKRRIAKRKDGWLFAELVPGGHDNKRSWQVDKAINDYLRGDLKLPEGVRFHQTRHSFATRMEERAIDSRWADRYFGHAAQGLMGKRYSHAKVLEHVAKAISYPPKVEQAFKAALGI